MCSPVKVLTNQRWRGRMPIECISGENHNLHLQLRKSRCDRFYHEPAEYSHAIGCRDCPGNVRSALAHEGEKHESASATEEVTVTGEVVDMVCYISEGASGAEHSDCAQTCIKMGLPVGIKTSDGKTYLLIGEHKPINAQLAPLAAKIITVKGKAVSRDGFNMIENAEIVKK